MQKFTQKYAIVCLLEDIEEGFSYSSSNWPLHTTFVDTFAIDWSVDTIKQKLEEASRKLTVISTKAIGDEYFGQNKEVHVVLLERNSKMKGIHCKLLDLLNEGNLKLNDPQYSKDGYIPHSTVQKHAAIKMGQEVKINNLALIDMFPGGDAYRRKVLKVVQLS